MSEAMHTPGPWNYGADKCLSNDEALAICKQNIDAHKKESSGYFYVVYVGDGRRTALVGHGPDGAANARLIAAAPELLEALQESLAALEYVVEQAGGPFCEHDGGVVCFCKENTAIGAARTAIAKATGQPHD
ncbi:hypothetical protein [Comamonas testosteroni]|uniref:Uncharacterized protein n=1 Tax=Comamonas testosteroni TaxID=285 RepID=A0A096F6T7_COMTE|nr:hypothetical protein [Comamonas testosteroni]KGH25453.1 hypothetical protein P353_25095 [Comamonas testosteroni]